MLIRVTAVQECDATTDAQRFVAGYIIIHNQDFKILLAEYIALPTFAQIWFPA